MQPSLDTPLRPRNPHRRAPGALARRDAAYGLLFVAPQLLGYLVFVLGPTIAVLVFSLQDRNLLTGRVRFVGLENFATMGQDLLFSKVMWNTLVFTAGLVPLNIVLALVLALILARRFAGVTLFRTLFFAPVVTSAVAWAIVWTFLLQGQQGTVNQYLAMVGIDGPNWLREPTWAMAALIVTRVLKNVGLNMVIFLAAVTNLPTHLMEAARIDGANGAQVLRHVTLPALAPTTLVVTVITLIASFQVFDHIALMTAGGPANATMVLVYYIYYQAFRFFETGYASALAVVLFLVTVLLTFVQWRLRSRGFDDA